MKLNVKYSIVNGTYHIDMTSRGVSVCGGDTGCKSYDEAYIYACKIAESKQSTIERFSK